MAVGLDGEHDARARRLAVEQNRAGAAHAVLAADVRAGQPEILADEIAEQQARLDLALVASAVDGDADDHASTFRAAHAQDAA